MKLEPENIAKSVAFLAKEGPKQAERVMKAGSKNRLTRLVTLAGLVFCLILPWAVALSWVSGQAEDETNRLAAKQTLQNNLNVLQYQSDLIGLCAAATERGSPMKDLDCKNVPDIFRNSSLGNTGNEQRVNDLIKEKDYRGMKVDIAHYIRVMQAKPIEDKAATKWYRINRLLSSEWSTAVFIVAVLSLYFYVVYRLMRLGGQFSPRMEFALVPLEEAEAAPHDKRAP